MRFAPRSLKGGTLALIVLTGVLFASGRPASAHDGISDQIARLTVQLSNDPANPVLLLRRAELYRATRQWKKALNDLDRVARLDPTIETVNLGRAKVLLDAGQPRGAV